MKENFPDNPDFSLEKIDGIEPLLPDAILLLENDFITSGIDVQLSGKILGDVFDLRDFIAQLIAKTGGPGSEQFYRLLYRVDIPETKIREALEAESSQPFDSRVAEMLIVRALLKAFFRRKYKS
jgi:hypothetical protein